MVSVSKNETPYGESGTTTDFKQASLQPKQFAADPFLGPTRRDRNG